MPLPQELVEEMKKGLNKLILTNPDFRIPKKSVSIFIEYKMSLAYQAGLKDGYEEGRINGQRRGNTGD